MTAEARQDRSLLLWLCAGFAVWSVAFLTLYAVMSVGCERGWTEVQVAGALSLQRLVLVIVFGVSALACAAVAWLAMKRRAEMRADETQQLLSGAAALAAIAALVATVVTLGPALVLTSCV